MIYLILFALVFSSLSYDDSLLRPRGRPEDEIFNSDS